MDRYEDPELLKQYIRSHYGLTLAEPYDKSESFYQTTLSEAKAYIPGRSALDVGCALGRLVFEYEKLRASRSVGIDTSRQFIAYCDERNTSKQVEFICGDLNDAAEIGTFDFISCINVIDRVKDPQKLVDSMRAHLSSGGVLLLVDPYDWRLSPAKKKLHVADMKELLDPAKWSIEKERRDLSYIVPISDTEDKTYLCHLLVAHKK